MNFPRYNIRVAEHIQIGSQIDAFVFIKYTEQTG